MSRSMREHDEILRALKMVKCSHDTGMAVHAFRAGLRLTLLTGAVNVVAFQSR